LPLPSRSCVMLPWREANFGSNVHRYE